MSKEGSSQSQVIASKMEHVFADDEAGVYIVADGIGDGVAADAAARLFCQTVASMKLRFAEVMSTASDDRELRRKAVSLIRQAFDGAAERIYRLAERRVGYGGMSTAATVLAVGPTGAVIGHVGDVRGYLMRDGDLRCLTRDHIYDAQTTEGAARTRSTLSRSVGQQPAAQPDTLWLDLAEADSIALCSFGLYQGLDHGTLLERLHDGLEGTARTARARAHDEKAEINGLAVEMTAISPTAIGTHEKIDLMRQVQLFQQLTDQEVVRMLRVVYERRLREGEVLCAEGQVGDSMYIVHDGSVSISKQGRHLVTLGPGRHLGEIAFIAGGERSATVTACEATTVLTFRREDFAQLGREEPQISAKVLWACALNLSDRIRDLSANVVSDK
jgi:serine/threonine protein phosphatase PrpC